MAGKPNNSYRSSSTQRSKPTRKNAPIKPGLRGRLLAHLNEDQWSFDEIAEHWAMGGHKAETIIAALVQSFWRGEFERSGKSRVFALVMPDSVAPERAPGNYVIVSDNLKDNIIARVGKDFWARATADRVRCAVLRREVAKALCWMPEYCPAPWDGTDNGLFALAMLPYESWPIKMREQQYSQWRLRRDDFAEWYGASQLRNTVALEKFWPPAEIYAPARERGWQAQAVIAAIVALKKEGKLLAGMTVTDRNDLIRTRVKELRGDKLRGDHPPSDRTIQRAWAKLPG
jgi:hypothetical protein